jgi:hypothetical protein
MVLYLYKCFFSYGGCVCVCSMKILLCVFTTGKRREVRFAKIFVCLLGRHDVVDLLQLVGKPLLLREFVLFQCYGQLLVVFHSVFV